MKTKKVELIEAKYRMVLARSWRSGKNGEMVVKEHKSSATR